MIWSALGIRDPRTDRSELVWGLQNLGDLGRPVSLPWYELVQDLWNWYRFELVRALSKIFGPDPIFLLFRSWSELILGFLNLSGPSPVSVRGSLLGISSAKKKVVAKKDPFKKTTVSTTLASFNYNKGLTIQEYVRINELFRQSHTKCKLNVDSTWCV